MEPYLLGIDIGTGSTKAVAVDLHGNTFNVSQQHYPVNSPQPGYSEQNPALILSAFVSCINNIVHSIGHAPLAISLSSAMHSLIPVDNTGVALAPMITWADARSEDIAQKLRENPAADRIYRTSGTPIHAMSPLCKLIWLRQNEAALFSSAYKFISIKEYIWFHLFQQFEIDYSLASATGLFDIISMTWNAEACNMAGISFDRLSIPVATTYHRADLSAAMSTLLNLQHHTPFIIGASDGCCANLGSFVTQPGIATLTIGTSGAVRITSKQPVYDNEAMIFNYVLNEQTFVCGGAVNNGGIVLDWLLKSFSPGTISYAGLFAQIASAPAGSEGLIFLPYLYGERAPLWDTKSCGVFFNIKPIHTQAHFLRAGLEGICFALNHVLQTLEASSYPVQQLNISGGFISSPVWTQLLADITGKILVSAQSEDASAIGAVFLAMDVLRIKRDDTGKPGSVITPNPDNYPVYSRNFELFKRLYLALKDTMHLVHDQNNLDT